jgi:hypothetical protein
MYYTDISNRVKDLLNFPRCCGTIRFELLPLFVQQREFKTRFRFEEHIETYDVLDTYMCSRLHEKQGYYW